MVNVENANFTFAFGKTFAIESAHFQLQGYSYNNTVTSVKCV